MCVFCHKPGKLSPELKKRQGEGPQYNIFTEWMNYSSQSEFQRMDEREKSLQQHATRKELEHFQVQLMIGAPIKMISTFRRIRMRIARISWKCLWGICGTGYRGERKGVMSTVTETVLIPSWLKVLIASLTMNLEGP